MVLVFTHVLDLAPWVSHLALLPVHRLVLSFFFAFCTFAPHALLAYVLFLQFLFFVLTSSWSAYIQCGSSLLSQTDWSFVIKNSTRIMCCYIIYLGHSICSHFLFFIPKRTNAKAQTASSGNCHSGSLKPSATPDWSLAFGPSSEPSVQSAPSHASMGTVQSPSKNLLQIENLSRNTLLREDVEPYIIALTPITIVLALDEHQADTSPSIALILSKRFYLFSYTPWLRSTCDAVLHSADIGLACPLISSMVNQETLSPPALLTTLLLLSLTVVLDPLKS